ncbi:MAG: GrpB family protein [Nocardioidaceae bacterium]
MKVVAPDPSWSESYLVARDRIRAALGDRVLAVEHIGSTAVPGLWAKPVIDIDLTVADSGDEGAWLPYLETAPRMPRPSANWRRAASATEYSTTTPRLPSSTTSTRRSSPSIRTTATTGIHGRTTRPRLESHLVPGP